MIEKLNITGIVNQGFLILGTFIIIYSIYSFFRSYKLDSKGIKVKSVVKEILFLGIDYGYTPVFEYETLDRRKIEKKGNFSAGSDDYKVNQQVEIIYDENNPEYFQIAGSVNKYYRSAGSFILGFVFVAAGILY